MKWPGSENCAWGWWVAGPAPLSGRCTAWPPNSMGRLNWLRARFLNRRSGRGWQVRRYKIDPDRAYADYKSMLEAERKRPDPIDFVAIVTPNHLALAGCAGRAGCGVSGDERQAGHGDLRRGGGTGEGGREKRVALWIDAHLCRATRWCARRGRCAPAVQLGKIRKIAVEYLQGWLTKPIEDDRAEAGGVAVRSGAERTGRVHRRHRRARVSSRPSM